MSDVYIIEVQSGAAGLVIRDQTAFRFFSANAAFAELDGLMFNHPSDAETAAERHRRGRAGAPAAAANPPRQMAAASTHGSASHRARHSRAGKNS